MIIILFWRCHQAKHRLSSELRLACPLAALTPLRSDDLAADKLEPLTPVNPIPARHTLEESVRLGSSPDDPQLLHAYLALCDELDCWRVYLRAHRTVLAVIRDAKVARRWRLCCQDHAYRPLAGLYRLARTDAERETVRQCNHELSLSSHMHLVEERAASVSRSRRAC
ncbi:MAG: hypothetical protein AAGA68_16640 [Pseudomonadota bacterium]